MGPARPPAVNECAQHIIPSLILLFDGLKRAYAAKASDTDDEENEDDDSDIDEGSSFSSSFSLSLRFDKRIIIPLYLCRSVIIGRG